MARVKGPLFSLEASGSVAKTITFSQWKGRMYLRKHTIPLNPSSAKQVNVRAAMTLLVAEWQTESAPDKIIWNDFAKQFNKSGFNVYVSRGMAEYVVQLGTSTTPASVDWTGNPPADVWVWT